MKSTDLAPVSAPRRVATGHRDGGPTMARTLRSETIKLVSTKAAGSMPLIGLAIPLLVTLTTVLAAEDPSRVNLVTAVMSTFPVVLVLPVAVVTSAFTSEVSYGTLRVTYACTPRRMQVLVAKLLVGVGYSMAVQAIVLTAAVAIGGVAQVLRGAPVGIDEQGPVRFALGIVVGGLFTMGGLACAYLVRSTAAAVTLVAVYPFAEGVACDLVRQSEASGWAKWFPFTAAFDASQGVTDVPQFGVETLGRPWGILYFAVLVCAAMAVAAWRELRRDV